MPAAMTRRYVVAVPVSSVAVAVPAGRALRADGGVDRYSLR